MAAPSPAGGATRYAAARAGEGRFVPTTASDQVGATLMQWMGLPAAALPTVLPNLVNVSHKTLSLLR